MINIYLLVFIIIVIINNIITIKLKFYKHFNSILINLIGNRL